MLTVSVWSLINDTCKLANIKTPTISELNTLLDQKTWNIYSKGNTCLVNQADSDYATGLVKEYKPHSVAEMSAFVACIRPGCASLLNDFIHRKDHSTGVKELDNILKDSAKMCLYQESIMHYLIWLGEPEDNTYTIIKKIAKKKFSKEELEELYKVAAAQREGKYYKPKDDIGWVNIDSYGLSYSYSSANYNEWYDVDEIDHTQNLIKNHEEALNKIQQRLAELHNKTQSAVEKAEKTSIAAQELLQKLEQISQPLITATQQIKDAESAMSQAQQTWHFKKNYLLRPKISAILCNPKQSMRKRSSYKHFSIRQIHKKS